MKQKNLQGYKKEIFYLIDHVIQICYKVLIVLIRHNFVSEWTNVQQIFKEL